MTIDAMTPEEWTPEQWETIRMAGAGWCNEATFDAIFQRIDTLTAEVRRLREKARRAEAMLVCVCGMSPSDPGWEWCLEGHMLDNAHIIHGPVPDYCGPVGTKAQP